MINYIFVEVDEEETRDEGTIFTTVEKQSNILGIKEVEKGKYFDIVIDFPLEDDKVYYLVVCVCSSGDSLTTIEGNLEFIDVYISREKAEETKRIIEDNYSSYYKDRRNYKNPIIVRELGKSFVLKCPWFDYFENLSEVLIQEVRKI